MGVVCKSSGLTVNLYVPLSDLCERKIVIDDWLSVKLKTNRSWTWLATWVVPPLLYLATIRAEGEGESGVKITSTWSRGVPSRVYVHRRVMLSFSTGYNGLEGVEIKDGACSLRKNKKKSYLRKSNEQGGLLLKSRRKKGSITPTKFTDSASKGTTS